MGKRAVQTARLAAEGWLTPFLRDVPDSKHGNEAGFSPGLDPRTAPLITFLLFLYPILLLAVRSAVSVCFVLLLVLVARELPRSRKFFLATAGRRCSLFYIFAMCSLVAATFLSQAYHRDFTLSAYDGPSRFMLAIPIYLLLLRIELKYLLVIQYGLVGGALIAGALALAALGSPNTRVRTYFLDPIHFGDMALVLGFAAILCINWARPDPPVLIAAKSTGFLAGLEASIGSGSRGGWVAVPLALLAWMVLARHRVSWRLKAVSALAATVAITVLFLAPNEFHDRMVQFVTDLRTLPDNQDTSLGIRLQIWRTALIVFSQNPVFGVGPDHFASAARSLVGSGLLSPLALQYAGAEVHQEILNKAATLGIFGLGSILLIYIVPLALFVRASRSANRLRYGAGLIGAIFTISFFVFGLTVEVFDLKTPATFYALTVAVLLAIALHPQLEPDKPGGGDATRPPAPATADLEHARLPG